MVIDIKMCKFEDVPWGFSLVGGSDFEYPLTVVKVTEGSIADESGLKVGDILVRINDIPTSPLTHDESNRILKSVGNIFFLGVQRESEENNASEPMFPVKTPQTFNEPNSMQSEVSELKEIYNPQDYQVINCSEPIDSGSEVNIHDTSQVLSEEGNKQLSQDGSSVEDMSRNPNTIDCIDKEGPKKKIEKEEESRKWTTFMQKPDRPIPKSKEDIAREKRAANAYKIKIVKSEPRQRSVSPAVCPNTEIKSKEEIPTPYTKPEPEEHIETVPLLQVTSDESLTPNKEDGDDSMPVDSEVPNLEKIDAELEGSDELSPVDNELSPLDDDGSQFHQNENDVSCEGEYIAEIESENTLEEDNAKMEEDKALAQQLHNVQKQLVALSNLPSTIQSALNSITRQLDELLPSIQQEKEMQISIDSDEKQDSVSEIVCDIPDDNVRANDEPENLNDIYDNDQDNETNKEDDNEKPNAMENDENSQEKISAQNMKCILTKNYDTQDNEEEQMLKKTKQQGVIGELEEHLERKTNTKHSKRAFGPLTPASDRPLVLPGGRRWYRPKDAYNDEFIAEIISAQAELINGSTLGVNFMKYQKPEKKIDLDKSEVYKIIHHLDKKPVRGIEVRPSIVPSEADIKKPDHI